MCNHTQRECSVTGFHCASADVDAVSAAAGLSAIAGAHIWTGTRHCPADQAPQAICHQVPKPLPPLQLVPAALNELSMPGAKCVRIAFACMLIKPHQPPLYFPPPQRVRRGADAERYGLQGMIIIIIIIIIIISLHCCCCSCSGL
jgi:hypothetical protein